MRFVRNSHCRAMPPPSLIGSPNSVSGRRWLNVLSGGILAVYAITFVLFFRRSGPRDGDQFLVFHSLQ